MTIGISAVTNIKVDDIKINSDTIMRKLRILSDSEELVITMFADTAAALQIKNNTRITKGVI